MTRTLCRGALAAVALSLGLGLAGCTAGAAVPTGTASPTMPSVSSSATATATATPIEQPTAGTTCDDVLTADAYATLEADGLLARESTVNDPIAMRIAEQGGLVCSWGKPQTDMILDVRQAVVTGDETAWTDALTGAGYTQTDTPVSGAWTGPVEPGSGLSPVVVLADTTVTFVSAPTFASWIRPAD